MAAASPSVEVLKDLLVEAYLDKKFYEEAYLKQLYRRAVAEFKETSGRRELLDILFEIKLVDVGHRRTIAEVLDRLEGPSTPEHVYGGDAEVGFEEVLGRAVDFEEGSSIFFRQLARSLESSELGTVDGDDLAKEFREIGKDESRHREMLVDILEGREVSLEMSRKRVPERLI